MFLKNHSFAVAVLASIILMAFIHLAGIALGIYDLFYLNDILSGNPVAQSKHDFYIKKNEVQYWTGTACYIIYLVCFLFWFYRTYRNVYIREAAEAPYKPAIVPFSFI